jgi:hypothetical protein
MSKSRFASLTAGLLARKGEAEPAATPFADQLLTRVGMPAQEVQLSPMPRHHGFGHRRAAPAIPPDVPSFFTDPPDAEPELPPPPAIFEPVRRVVQLRPAMAEALLAGQVQPEPAASCAACPSPEDAGKVYHVNLRLKRKRFVRLKLTAALTKRPVQDIVAEALDAWFAQMPDELKDGCPCMGGAP